MILSNKILLSLLLLFSLTLSITDAKAANFNLSCPAGTGISGPNNLSVGGPGTATDTLTVTNAPAGTVITFSYQAQNGPPRTMAATLTSGSATGPTPASVALASNGDTGSQVFTTTAAGTSSYNIPITTTRNGRSVVDWTATCTLPTPSLTVEIANDVNGAEPATNGTLIVTQSGISVNDTVISLSFAGAATGGGIDYTAPNIITIPANSTSATITLSVIDDLLIEGPEAVDVTLASIVSGDATLGAVVTATNIIADNDATATIVAMNDSQFNADGVSGVVNILNAFTGDTINGVSADNTNTVLSLAPSATLPSQLTFNTATGDIDLLPNTPAGTYSFDYQICEAINTSNCQIATITVGVIPNVDLVITKTNTPGVNGEVDQTSDTVTSGDIVTYTITVTNNGPDSTAGAVVTDNIVSGLTCTPTDTLTITGDGVPTGSFTIADLIGAGITLDTLDDTQSTIITYSCIVN